MNASEVAQVLPTLLPLVEPGGTLTGVNNQLFLRTSAKNRAENAMIVDMMRQTPSISASKLGTKDQALSTNPAVQEEIRRMLQLATRANEDPLVLDFFAGSGSTMHGIFVQNAEDGGNRRGQWMTLFDFQFGRDK